MIHQKAIDEYLSAPRESHVWVKRLTERELDDALEEMDFKPLTYDPPLKKHQKACILLGLAYPHFAFWLDMGTGKTRIVLELLSHYWRHGWLQRGLIGCVSEVGVFEWADQIEKWGCPIPYVLLPNSPTEEKWETVAEMVAGLILISYPGLARMLASKQAISKGRTKLKKDNKLLKRIGAVDAFIPDESTKLGNHNSLQYKVCKALSARARYRYPLAGRPFGKDPSLVWSQQFIADRGASLGQTLGLFRAAFFDEKPGYFGGMEYKFRESMRDKLAECMAHRSIAYASDECSDLPPVTRQIEKVTLADDVQGYFDEAVRALRAAKGDRIKINNLFLRMRQLSSGFLGYKDDQTGEKAQILFPQNPKLDRLLELIEAVPDDRKFVVFYEFTVSGRMIVEELKKRKKEIGNVGWLWSGTSDVRSLRKRFDESPKDRGLVVNWRKGGMGPNLQVANYMFVYESPVGVIDREQMEFRCFRQGQQHPGFLFDLVAKGTADAGILKSHAKGESLLNALLRDPSRALEEALAPEEAPKARRPRPRVANG